MPFLDPQLYLPLEISDFEMLSPEPRGAFFVIFLLPILHVQRRKIAVLASRRLRELFSDLLREAPLHELYITEHVKKIIFPGHPDVSQGTCGTRSPQPAESSCPSSRQTSKIFSNTLVFPAVTLASFCVPLQRSPLAPQAHTKTPLWWIPAWLQRSPISSPTVLCLNCLSSFSSFYKDSVSILQHTSSSYNCNPFLVDLVTVLSACPAA